MNVVFVWSIFSESDGIAICWHLCYNLWVLTSMASPHRELHNNNKDQGITIFTYLLLATAHARISVMYAHEKLSDIAAENCFTEMYPKGKKVEIQESDEPCLIFCVLRKIGIMNSNGQINLEVYRKRVQIAHHLDQRVVGSDFGSSCVENAEAIQHKQDVCKKAKVFNDCTHLYRMLLKK